MISPSEKAAQKIRTVPMNSEREIRRILKRLSQQRVALVLQPGNVWVIEDAIEDNEETDAALKTAYMRGWVAPIENAVPKGKLTSDGALPSGNPFQEVGPLWKTGGKPETLTTFSSFRLMPHLPIVEL